MKNPLYRLGGVFRAAALGGVFALSAQSVFADIPDRQNGGNVWGMYQVVSSNDPLFPERENTEWFLDFGKGVSEGRTNGTVAVSMRQNPNVKVKLMVWQIFADRSLKIGAQTHEGSRQAVAVADWQMTPLESGMMLERGPYQVVLNRAQP